MLITDRYASAIKSSSLKVDPRTTYSDTDVLGAFGIADRRLSQGINANGDRVADKRPLAVPLQRLLLGDNGAAVELVDLLAGVIATRSKGCRLDMSKVQAADMARGVVAWFRDSACKPCGGHGFKVIKGTNAIGPGRCGVCKGSGKIPIERLFRVEQRELLRWAMAQVEDAAAQAGPAAMRAIAPSLDL